MTKGNVLDQKICNIPFEVVATYDNGPQILQQNTNNNYSPLVNVKIRIRNKEHIGEERHGIVSVPKLNTKNWPKKMRLVNSDQTIMSFNLALEPNSEEVQQKSSKRLFQMFRPGGCLSSKRDEDGYSYMPSTSNDLKRKSESGIEDYENNRITGAFSLKKNNFSSYTNTLKTPKTFLGKCKPGGCLDPPFSEDKYSYKPTVEDVQTLPQPAINTNSLDQDLNIIDIKQDNTTQNQKINTLHQETNILENTAMLITYPSTLSSSKLKNKGNQNRKSNLRIRSEQMELSKKNTNEFPEAYFIPPRNEKLKQGKSSDKYNCVEKEPQIREAYVNKDYIFQSQTPSESDAPIITSQSYDEPRPDVIKEKIISNELNSIKLPLLKSEGVLNNKTFKDNIKTNNTTFTAKIDESTILQNQNSSHNNNIPIMKHISSNIAESKVDSTIKVETVQETADDTNIEKKEKPNNNSVSEAKNQSMLYSTDLRNEISTQSCKSSIDQSSMLIDNFKVTVGNSVLRQHQNVSDKEIDKVEISNIKEQIEVQSELTQSKSIENSINLVKVKKSRSQEFENVKIKNGQVTSYETLKHTLNTKTNYPDTIIGVQNQGDDKKMKLDKSVSDQFENISEPTELFTQELEFKGNKKDNMKEPIDHKTEKTTKEIIDIQPLVVTELLPKVPSYNSLDQISELKSSYSGLMTPKNININPEDSLLRSTKSKQLIKEENKTDKHNEKQNKSFDTLQYTLPTSLITGHTSSQISEINSKKSSFSMSLHLPEPNFEIGSNHEKLDAADTNVTPVTLSLNYLTRSENELDNQNYTKSQRALSIISQIKTSDDAMELTGTVSQSRQEFIDFDSSSDHKFLYNSMSKKELTYFYPLISDEKKLLPIQKYDINLNKQTSKQDILSDEKSRNELTNSIKSLETLPNPIIHQEPKLGVNVLERKKSSSSSQNLDNSYSAEKVQLNKDHLSFTDIPRFLKDLDKFKTDIISHEKKTSQNLDNLQELKIMEPSPKINKSFTYIKNDKSISSIAINFGFHTSTNEKSRPSIRTFDPSINLENYPQDKFFTIKTILRKNDSEIKMQIDSITNLTMQIKSTKQLNGSGKLAMNVLNDKRKNNLRVHSSEILINKEKLLQETLKGLYETLIPIEKNIIKLKEEADTLHREHLLLKEVLFSKKIKPYKIVPNVRTCSCLRREIGLE